jgi:hypothetical protein
VRGPRLFVNTFGTMVIYETYVQCRSEVVTPVQFVVSVI